MPFPLSDTPIVISDLFSDLFYPLRVLRARSILLLMVPTYTYRNVLPSSILDRYTIYEVGYAAAIMNAVCPNAFADIVNVLEDFHLSARMLLNPGGSRGLVPQAIDGAFDDLGWIEARVDTERTSYLIKRSGKQPKHGKENEIAATIYQEGYNIDNVKDALAVDVEWHPKDGNLDRDLSAYRAWHEEGFLVGAALITRVHAETRDLGKKLWDEYIVAHPEDAKKKHAEYTTTTTANYEKALDRVKRGDGGTCPLILFGIGEKTWDGEPFDGRFLRKSNPRGPYRLEHI